MAKGIKILVVAFLAGCSVPVVVRHGKMPPALPKHVVRPQVLPYVPAVPPLDLPYFKFAEDRCNYVWTLQGSSDLVTWVDLDNVAAGCPTVTVDITNTAPMYFYRMKGTK